LGQPGSKNTFGSADDPQNMVSDFIIQTAKSIRDPITIQFEEFVKVYKEPIKDYYQTL
jgi:hypothetical protein